MVVTHFLKRQQLVTPQKGKGYPPFFPSHSRRMQVNPTADDKATNVRQSQRKESDNTLLKFILCAQLLKSEKATRLSEYVRPGTNNFNPVP